MIDTTVPTGAQPRPLVLEVIRDTFEHAMRLADAGNEPPKLDPSVELARAAQRREDVVDLVEQLRNVSVAAMATRVRILAAMEEELGSS